MAQTFDVTFKVLFRHSHGILSRLLFGESFEWQNIEQPEVRNQRADLLATSADGSYRHVELQLTNDPNIAFRMLDYYVGFYRCLGAHVQQTILYTGRTPLRMANAFASPSTRHEFTIIELRELDGAELLASDEWADNEFALLTRADTEKVITAVLAKLRMLAGEEQEVAASTFAIIGGILGIGDRIEQRLRTDMIDIMENKILGPAIRQGLEKGRQEGRQEGQTEGMVRVLRHILERRFGTLPPWALEKLNTASLETLDAWSERVTDTAPLDHLLS